MINCESVVVLKHTVCTATSGVNALFVWESDEWLRKASLPCGDSRLTRGSPSAAAHGGTHRGTHRGTSRLYAQMCVSSYYASFTAFPSNATPSARGWRDGLVKCLHAPRLTRLLFAALCVSCVWIWAFFFSFYFPFALKIRLFSAVVPPRPARSSPPPPRRNSCLNTLSERGCVSENQSSANERRSPPTLWRLFTTEAGRRLVERWGKSGFMLRSGAPKRVGELVFLFGSTVRRRFLSGKQLENLALVHRTSTSV